jgi:SAM-dependent methyltransferase
MNRFVLFPGRHHLLTRFQADYLRRFDATVIWAVTSANHQNTKRNPIAYDRRQAANERLSAQVGLRSLVVPVFDTAPTDRFAEVTLKSVEAVLGERLTADNTTVACSTPEVAAMYEELGFPIAPVEAGEAPAPDRPWDVLLRLAAGDDTWRDLAHPATVDVFDRYRLDAQVRAVVNDPVVGEEGGLTATRDYRTYADAFEASADRKWTLVRDFVRPGRIVDIGCGAGAVLALADREPALRESDLIGVEVARHLFEECVHRKAQGWFTNPNVYFYCRNVLGGAVFPARSIDTTLTFALTHEIYSYGQRLDAVKRFAQAIYDHTVPGGVWINSDVCGPDGRDRTVHLRLRSDDGGNPEKPRSDLASLSQAEIAAYVESLSTRARLEQFVADFHFPLTFTGEPVSLGDAMEYLEHKDYADNWLSEAHERFCGLEFADWKALLADVGFEIDPASRAWRNDWIVEHRMRPVASLSTADGLPMDWPNTHVLLVARRPLNT